MRTDTGVLLRSMAAALVVAVAILLVAPPLGFRPNTLGVIVGCVAVAAMGTYLYLAGETADAVEWPTPPLPDELPAHPSEVRARRLSREVKGALERAPLSSKELGHTLADLVADRMILHHGADPEHPLVGADAHLSPGLAAHIAAAVEPDAPMPRINRTTLHAYCKEIEDL